MLVGGLYFQFVQCKLSVIIKCLKNLLVFLKQRVSTQKLENLLNDLLHFILNLIEYPLIVLTSGKNTGVLQVNQMAGGFRLCKFKNMLKVSNAHLSIRHDQVKNTETRSIGAGQKYLRPGFNIEMF
jgi:hypothetical protein